MIKINIEFQELRRAVKHLPTKQRTRLVEELQRDTWQNRFRQLLARIDARQAKHPMPQKELLKIVETAREKFHAQRRH